MEPLNEKNDVEPLALSDSFASTNPNTSATVTATPDRSTVATSFETEFTYCGSNNQNVTDQGKFHMEETGNNSKHGVAPSNLVHCYREDDENNIDHPLVVVDDTGDDDNDDTSIPSNVTLLDVKDLSRSELMELVEKLYHNLKSADRGFLTERSRRYARERALLKLARQLKRHKERLSECMERMEEVRCVHHRTKGEAETFVGV